MHNAPSVTYPVGRSSWAAWGFGAVWALGVAATAWWTWHWPAPGWRAPLAWLACFGAAALALRTWRNSPLGVLHWDGGGWRWHGAGQPEAPGTLQVALDFQSVLLLRFRSPAGGAWLWVERANAPERWHALRRAVYSRANPDGLGGAVPPPATP